VRPVFALLMCLSAVPVLAQSRALVFSEIMWMGSETSSADEWMELYNPSAEPVDLSGWRITRLVGDAEETMLELPDVSLGPNNTFLIANYAADDARSALAVAPDLVDPAISLANSRLLLRLYDAAGQLVDSADDGSGAPFAGDAEGKRAMVREDLLGDGGSKASWRTAGQASGWDAGTQAMGTPGTVGMPTPTTTAVRSVSWGRAKEAVHP